MNIINTFILSHFHSTRYVYPTRFPTERSYHTVPSDRSPRESAHARACGEFDDDWCLGAVRHGRTRARPLQMLPSAYAAARAAAPAHTKKAGKVVVMTGATGEIGGAIAQGMQTANLIAPTVGTLVLLVRNAFRGEKIAAPLRGKTMHVDVVVVDLSKPAAVAQCAQALCKALPQIDVLICGAAEVTPTRQEMEGVELQFSTSVLSAFILMTGLLPSMTRLPKPARVVLIGDAQLAGGLDVRRDLHSTFVGASGDDAASYDAVAVYAKTKQALFMLGKEAAKAGRAPSDAAVIVCSCHPGNVGSNLSAALGPAAGTKTDGVAAAAKTPLFLALGPAPESGTYWNAKKQHPCTHAADAAERSALWDACTELTRSALESTSGTSTASSSSATEANG